MLGSLEGRREYDAQLSNSRSDLQDPSTSHDGPLQAAGEPGLRHLALLPPLRAGGGGAGGGGEVQVRRLLQGGQGGAGGGAAAGGAPTGLRHLLAADTRHAVMTSCGLVT